jgi:hypothetical protein
MLINVYLLLYIKCCYNGVADDIEQVHADASTCIVVADAPVLWIYETATCLTGVDFFDYQFISIDRKGFTPVMLEPMENRPNPK